MLLQSAKSAHQRSPELHRRVRILVVVVIALLFVLVGRLWQLQVLRGEQYYRQARDRPVRERAVPPVRGKIVDREGRPLADNRPAFNIYGIASRIAEAERARLIALLELSPEEVARLDERIATALRQKQRGSILLLDDQGRDRAALVAQDRDALGGLEVHDEPYRRYPQGLMAAHLIGYLSHPTPKELAACEAAGCASSDFIGRYGVEREQEAYLRGKPGLERYVANARGDRVADAEAAGMIEGERFVPPITGHDVVLSIDMDLQRAVETATARHSAAAVAVVEVDSGRILALSSTPSFDPNVMTGHLTQAEDARLRADPRRPYSDKAVQQDYPPGSVFKFVTGAAAREAGAFAPSEHMFCPGYYQRGRDRKGCTHAHGSVDFFGAMQHSCNIYFWTLSERIGLDKLAAVARDFGFGEPSGLGLNSDRPGRIPTKAWYEERGSFRAGYTLNAATGQGDVEVTVLQVAMAYAAIANGGRLYKPQAVWQVRTAGGAVVHENAPVLRRQISLQRSTFDMLRESLHRVVNLPGGTAYAVRSQVIEFSGKTGTAQAGNTIVKDDGRQGGWNPRRDHAWFAGYAPSRRPEIAIAVLVEHGGPGGKVAGPVAHDVIEAWARLNGKARIGPPVIR